MKNIISIIVMHLAVSHVYALPASIANEGANANEGSSSSLGTGASVGLGLAVAALVSTVLFTENDPGPDGIIICGTPGCSPPTTTTTTTTTTTNSSTFSSTSSL